MIMQDVNVVVTFWSRTGCTEKLALAAALGAVQARANIRLRWLQETAGDRSVDGTPGWREHRERMAMEYVPPREADLRWADAVIIAIPARVSPASAGVNAWLEFLAGTPGERRRGCKVAAAFTSGERAGGDGDLALPALYAACAQRGLIIVPGQYAAGADPVEMARLHGQRVAAVARVLKAVD